MADLRCLCLLTADFHLNVQFCEISHTRKSTCIDCWADWCAHSLLDGGGHMTSCPAELWMVLYSLALWDRANRAGWLEVINWSCNAEIGWLHLLGQHHAHWSLTIEDSWRWNGKGKKANKCWVLLGLRLRPSEEPCYLIGGHSRLKTRESS